jgi:hypothetical protein
MKSPNGLSAALFGGWCWFISSIASATMPSNYAPNGDIPATSPASDTAAFRTVGDDEAPLPALFEPDSFCYRWQVWANALFVTRSDASGQSLVYEGKGPEIFDSGDLDFGFGFGPQVGVARCLNECNSVSVEFYAIDDWSAEGQVAGDISVQFPSFPWLPDEYGVAAFRYTSNLYNTEINFRHRASDTSWLTTLAGFRWIEFGEDFGTVFETGGITPNYTIDVNNHLYGFQLGALANVQNCGPWFLDGWVKAGVYGNAADQETREDFTSVPNGSVTYAAARDSNVAFAGDIGVSVGRRITDRLSARLGYMALWIEGVALAPEQLDHSVPSAGTATVDNGGGVFCHGGFVGCEYLW